MKVKGYYKGIIPVYITIKNDVIFLEGTNWFWEKLLTFCFNLDVMSGNLEEVDYQEYIKEQENKLKPEDFR